MEKPPLEPAHSVYVFGAAWCQPCRRLHALLDELRPAYPDVAVIEVDIEEQPRLAERFHVRSVPTLIAVAGDRVVASQVGLGPRRRVVELLDGLGG